MSVLYVSAVNVYFLILQHQGPRKVKIALIQINPIIGDFSYNCRKMVEQAHKANEQGCELAVFPEMVVSGYPPQDLLERPSFINDQEKAVEKMLGLFPKMHVLFGLFERCPSDKAKPLYNSAVVACDGKIIHRTRKQLLPTYDVFDEKRYFEPGLQTELFQLGSLTFGLTVCEDIWFEEIGEYEKEPLQELFDLANRKETSIDAVVNISASPFQRGKRTQRTAMMAGICRRYQTPLLYVNQVGGQDSLLFEGGSMLLDSTGEIRAYANQFKEDLIVIDSQSWSGDQHGDQEPDEMASIYDALIMGIKDYTAKCSFTSAVLGLSGGIDSALTAALASKALGPENVLCVALPSPYSSRESMEDARHLARNLGCRFEVIPINDLFGTFQSSLSQMFTGQEEDLTEQNIQARIRGNLLMALSNKFGHILLTTGNKSEMAVGYCTLYGDMSGGLAVISDVPKQLVYELSHYINRKEEIIPKRIITKAPTAELKPNQCDQDDLPPYEILDQILELHLEQGQGLQEIITQGFDEAVVRDVLNRIRTNEYKRKQAPIGLKVTSKAFGYGRRYPNVQNYRE